MSRKSYIIDSEEVKQILDIAVEIGAEIECFEGTLLDSYIIYDASEIVVDGEKSTKYIIMKEKYLNTWSSTTEIEFTDDEDIVDKFRESMEE